MDLAQAFFLMKALKGNLPAKSAVDQKWVTDFHSILEAVEKETGSDLSVFRVQSVALFHPAISARRASRHGPGQVLYSNKTVIERERL